MSPVKTARRCMSRRDVVEQDVHVREINSSRISLSSPSRISAICDGAHFIYRSIYVYLLSCAPRDPSRSRVIVENHEI